MDNIKDILSSNLLNRYMVGDVSPEEQLKVDMLRIDHRIIRNRLQEIELQLEQDHLSKAIHPPAGTKEAIVKSICGGDVINPSKAISKNVTIKWWPIAASVLLSGLAMWLVMNKQLSNERATVTNQKERLEFLKANCEKLNAQFAFINHSATKPIILESLEDNTGQAIVYCNESLDKSMIKNLNLPEISKDQTFQLWADVNGEMLSLGTFRNDSEDMITLSYLSMATSLNITIEPLGGSSHPTLETLTASKSI